MDKTSNFKTSAPWFIKGLVPYVVSLISGNLGMTQRETADLLEFVKKHPDCLRRAIDKSALKFGEEWRDLYCE